MPARDARTAPWPEWVPAPLRSTLGDAGIAAPWAHQVEAAELAWAGRSVVVATGTASGKSLAYLLPMLTAVLAGDATGSCAGRGATALYLSPTKALAADQLRALDVAGAARACGPRPTTATPPRRSATGCARTPTSS